MGLGVGITGGVGVTTGGVTGGVMKGVIGGIMIFFQRSWVSSISVIVINIKTVSPGTSSSGNNGRINFRVEGLSGGSGVEARLSG